MAASFCQLDWDWRPTSRLGRGFAPLDDGPDIERILAWAKKLAQRGVPAQLTSDGQVRVGDHIVPPPSQGEQLDRAAKMFVRDKTRANLELLGRRVSTAIGTADPKVWVRTNKSTVTVHVLGPEFARIDRYSVKVVGQRAIQGDVLNDERLLRTLGHALARRRSGEEDRSSPFRGRRPRGGSKVASTPAAIETRQDSSSTAAAFLQDQQEVLLEFPEDLPDNVRERAIVASARLRHERRRVPAVGVKVVTPNGTVVYEPIDESSTPLEVTFRFASPGGTVLGALRLKRPDDPLALRVIQLSSQAVLGEAWAVAIVVYAALTCGEPSFAARTPSKPALSQTPRGPAPRDDEHSSGVPRRTTTEPIQLEDWQRGSVPRWAVEGFVRRLPKGQKMQPTARRAAKQVGVTVPPGHTWVRRHSRGERLIQVVWPRRPLC